MHDESLSPELRAVEQALAGLTPAAHFDRDGLLFAAGRAAAERDAALAQRSWRRRVWPLATAALALLSAGLGAALVVRAPRTQIVVVERPTPSIVAPLAPQFEPPAPPPVALAVRPRTFTPNSFPPESYASLREQALRGVFDRPASREFHTTPNSQTQPENPPTYRALRDELLETAG